MAIFDGIKVLDLSRVLAGPYAGQLLADFGAEVIKVEAPGGDENRSWEPNVDGLSSTFISVNRGKRAMTLNLKAEQGKAILRRLLLSTDVVIESFPPATAARLGLDHDTLLSINPRLIHASITGYGHQGPLRNRPGYDVMLQGFTGMMAMTGERGGGPVRAGASFIDMSTGMTAFAGISAALYARATGQATHEHITVSLMETGISLLGYHVPAYDMAGIIPPREGSGVWHLVPYQAFETLDGWILAGATNDAAWQRLCLAIDTPHFAADARFAKIAQRIKHRDELISAISAIFATRSTADWVQRLDEHNVPCTAINDVAQTLAHPQTAAMNMALDTVELDGKMIRSPGVPINLRSTPTTPGSTPPTLGQHTAEILAELGDYDEARIGRLRDDGVI